MNNIIKIKRMNTRCRLDLAILDELKDLGIIKNDKEYVIRIFTKNDIGKQIVMLTEKGCLEGLKYWQLIHNDYYKFDSIKQCTLIEMTEDSIFK